MNQISIIADRKSEDDVDSDEQIKETSINNFGSQTTRLDRINTDQATKLWHSIQYLHITINYKIYHIMYESLRFCTECSKSTAPALKLLNGNFVQSIILFYNVMGPVGTPCTGSPRSICNTMGWSYIRSSSETSLTADWCNSGPTSKGVPKVGPHSLV